MNQVYTNLDAFVSDCKDLGITLPVSDNIGILSEPYTVGCHTTHNRLCAQPMEGCDGNPDGSPSELTYRRYERIAKGGSGIIWFEATACVEEGKANPRQLYLNEKTADSFERLVAFIKETGYRANGFEPVVIMQNTHSGRYSKPHGKPEPLIAYNNPVFEKDSPISSDRIVSDDYLDEVCRRLVENSGLASRVGFDGVDVKACHRYLNSELLSAYTRTGRYGGSFENRTRLLREAIQGSKETVPNDFIVTTRLNVYDGFSYPYGFGVAEGRGEEMDLSEPIELLRLLDLPIVNITMGNPYFNPHVNRPFSRGGYQPPEHPLVGVSRLLNGTAEIRRAVTNTAFICSGVSFLGTVSAGVAAGFIEKDDFQVAGFGRMSIANPEYALQITKDGRIDASKICRACSYCTQLMRNGMTPGCVVRDPYYAQLAKELNRKN